MRAKRRMLKLKLLVFILAQCILQGIHAQYFGGPNKPDYKVINYKVYTTPHFEFYHYFDNDSVISEIAQIAEKWYQRHTMIFKDTFRIKNPVIIYADHADFQQTNAIMGNIGVGTGGVTEALRNRVVLPIMESAAQTDHVLGHELVHAFQYRLLLGEDSLQLRNIRNIPLWMVEGMAEYLSIGSKDPHTAMWMRDALLNNDFPSLEDMSRSYKYFPYRYGQAFWAFVTSVYGDTIIKPLFDLTSMAGYDRALDSLVHVDEKTFSKAWKASLKDYYFPLLKDTVEKPTGSKILSIKNSGAVNIAPSISPDGKYVMFLSEKDLFTFDLYIADALTGQKVKKVTSTIRDNQIDDFNYLESGGSWSPDSRYFAFVTFSKGRNRLLIVDAKRRRNHREYDIKGVGAFSNPSWNPDGKSIVVTGLVNARTDLYRFFPESGEVENLTHDKYCNLMPSWSSDGKSILFSTDRAVSGDTFIHEGYNIAIYDLQKKSIRVLPVFEGADNLNPQFSADEKKIYFLSDADGFRNLYVYKTDSGSLYRLTHLNTGISGITKFTPAFSIDRKNSNIIYTHFWKGEYNLHVANDTAFQYEPVSPDSLNFSAALLPSVKRTDWNIVDDNISGLVKQNKLSTDSFKPMVYKPNFQLDYIGGSSVGVGVSSYYGTGMAGSVDMLFSDIVGDYQMYSSLAINGEIYDFAGSVAFINNKNKIDWGAGLSHIPYRYGYYSRSLDSIDGNVYDKVSLNYHRIFEDAFTLFAIRPLSQTRRIELTSSYSYYSERLDKYNYYYDKNGYSAGQDIERNLPTEKGFSIISLSTAYTLDNAYMGITSPLRGQRFRAEIGYYTGYMNFYSLTLDYRKYFFWKPFCLAMRLYHQGRYGNESTNYVMRSLYLGWPWLVRGFYNFDPGADSESELSQLYGSRIAVANLELRIPFTGPERLCLIPFKYMVTELSFFTDAGMAWNSHNKLTLDRNANKKQQVNYKNISSTASDVYNLDRSHYRYPMMSYGVSLRINMFGYMVLEPYYAIPVMTNGTSYAGLSLNFLPGW